MLGPDVEIEIEAYDECNTIIDVDGDRSARSARPGAASSAWSACSRTSFRARSTSAASSAPPASPVVIGGFHVSGCIAMLPELPPDLRGGAAISASSSSPARAKGRMAELLRDIAAGTPKPIYNYLDDMPDMAAAALPILPREVVTRVAGHYTSFDAGRGCPFQCSFCTIINVQGRKSRYRTADDVEAIVRANAAQGITRFFVTDDNFARNRNWEPILDRLIELREQRRASRSACCCRSTRCATAFRASSRRRRAPAATRSSSGSRTSIPNR